MLAGGTRRNSPLHSRRPLRHFCVPCAVGSARRHVLPCARYKAHGEEAVRRLALCRARFAVCISRHASCCVPQALCRVPQAHGKARESGSAGFFSYVKLMFFYYYEALSDLS